MAFNYIDYLSGCYSISYLEKFSRATLPEWIGWYNPYDYSFSYEFWNESRQEWTRRVIPKRLPNVKDFGFIDLSLPDRDQGIIIFRQEDSIKWLRFTFGYTTDDRDDVIVEGPYTYSEIAHPYYLYVHDIVHFFNGKKITYFFVTDGTIRVFYFWHDDPATIYEIDMSEVDGWQATQALYQCTDVRISKTALITSGKHDVYYYPAGVYEVTGGYYHIFGIQTHFDEEHSTLRFRSNVPSVVYYVDGTRTPDPSVDPFLTLQTRVVEGEHIYHQNYLDTSTFLEGMVSYTGYETDFEWISDVAVITIDAGGFAYILLI